MRFSSLVVGDCVEIAVPRRGIKLVGVEVIDIEHDAENYAQVKVRWDNPDLERPAEFWISEYLVHPAPEEHAAA